MSKEEAIYTFFSAFGDAYEESSVPTGKNAPSYPYLTYTVPTDSFNFPTAGQCSLWYKENTWLNADAKAKEICAALPKIIACDGGGVLLTKGSPFSQRMSEPADSRVRRVFINITAEFITAD